MLNSPTFLVLSRLLSGSLEGSHLVCSALTPSYSLTVFKDNLIIAGCKYPVEVIRSSPTSFNVSLNGSSVDVRTRKMVDGGFLMQVSLIAPGRWWMEAFLCK
jgi:hypothetical protein